MLDPFEVGCRNMEVLRQQLNALDRQRWLNIIKAYDLNPANIDLSWMTETQLTCFIMVAVETRLFPRRRRFPE